MCLRGSYVFWWEKKDNLAGVVGRGPWVAKLLGRRGVVGTYEFESGSLAEGEYGHQRRPVLEGKADKTTTEGVSVCAVHIMQPSVSIDKK